MKTPLIFFLLFPFSVLCQFEDGGGPLDSFDSPWFEMVYSDDKCDRSNEAGIFVAHPVAFTAPTVGTAKKTASLRILLST